MRNLSEASSANTANYLVDSAPPVCRLECAVHFAGLSPQEQAYSHHISRASFYGSRICLRQASPWAEDIFDLFLNVFKGKNRDALKSTSGVSDEAWGHFLDYSAQFLSNLGDYKTFGDVKFVPRVSVADFGAIVSAAGSKEADGLWAKTKDAIYGSSWPDAKFHLGFPEEGHVTGFYDAKITKADIAEVQKALEANDITPLNTRLFFDEAGHFKLLIASAELLPTKEIKTETRKVVKLVFGDHKDEMKKAAEHLAAAVPLAANENQAKMLEQCGYLDESLGFFWELICGFVARRRVFQDGSWRRVRFEPEILGSGQRALR